MTTTQSFLTIAIAAGICFISLHAVAQSNTELYQKADSAFPCSLDPKARAFDFWIGEWDAYITGTQKMAGHSVIQAASGGCMILENWTSGKGRYAGKSMNFIDAATGKWQQVWVGSEGGGQHVFVNGEYRDSAMRFDFEQKGPDGKQQKGRFTFFNQGTGQVRQLNETSDDEGKTWKTQYDLTYIRKK
ncbi:MAG TPA: hypothetical protein VNU72_01610 [Puia sp.]|nr:hypothetical protein [Puia sp.]